MSENETSKKREKPPDEASDESKSSSSESSSETEEPSMKESGNSLTVSKDNQKPTDLPSGSSSIVWPDEPLNETQGEVEPTMQDEVSREPTQSVEESTTPGSPRKGDSDSSSDSESYELDEEEEEKADGEEDAASQSKNKKQKRNEKQKNTDSERDSEGDKDSDSSSLKEGQKKPRKLEHMGKEEKKEYKKAKKEWKENLQALKETLTPAQFKEYKKEKKELDERERQERKRERMERRRLMKEKKKMYKRPKIGKLVTQETKSYELVCDMLLGIRVTVSKVSARALKNHAVKDSDFKRVHNIKFPSAGSSTGPIPTPAHSQRDFTFRDYAPVVFRHLREHFGIESADYLISLTGDYILSELISPGQSGQFFYFSYDLRFMLKTVTKGEAQFLKAILPRYYNHIMKNPDTLLARFFGFHRVSPSRDRKHYFVVMGNIFAQNLEIRYRFDLKGSFVGRVTSTEKIKNDPNVVMKDQDFDRLRKTIALGPTKRKLFISQVTKDVQLLEELGIMDYSLLLGIHDRRQLKQIDRRRSLSMVYLPKATEEEEIGTAKAGFNADTDSDSDYSDSDEEKIEQHHITAFTQEQGGLQSTDENDNPTDYIYFMGIIDILQPYNLRKRAEHGFKSLRYERDSISAVNPRLYARRFRDFMFARVKQPEPVQTPREQYGLPSDVEDMNQTTDSINPENEDEDGAVQSGSKKGKEKENEEKDEKGEREKEKEKEKAKAKRKEQDLDNTKDSKALKERKKPKKKEKKSESEGGSPPSKREKEAESEEKGFAKGEKRKKSYADIEIKTKSGHESDTDKGKSERKGSTQKEQSGKEQGGASNENKEERQKKPKSDQREPAAAQNEEGSTNEEESTSSKKKQGGKKNKKHRKEKTTKKGPSSEASVTKSREKKLSSDEKGSKLYKDIPIGEAAKATDSSPRTGNAGLVPKQLKVEKKKQQKAEKKQKKESEKDLLLLKSKDSGTTRPSSSEGAQNGKKSEEVVHNHHHTKAKAKEKSDKKSSSSPARQPTTLEA